MYIYTCGPMIGLVLCQFDPLYMYINSSAGEANYCCTHVVHFRVAGKPSLQTIYTNMSRKQLLTCVVTTKVLTV